ncbi:ABC transporter substrate-binding protein [Aureliella helgolandensis]|uniref:D-ribose-binding periplasmic protein n=1 Tax=Aureliella helgolandensis TaxID=2527968 RepID=A0A518GHD3_9BACT|nr:substrate-binding domain-containing protein [Aureliella helgolandensis]QDV27999.1 D-ribose-binding periplasmic protein precursor [Aureliella helgolandensis]
MQRMFSVVFCLTLCLLLTACEPGSESSASKSGAASADGKLRIAVIPKGTSHQFWMAVKSGAEAAAEELGNVEVLWKGPETEADTMGQISVVKNFITGQVDGICLAPNHSQALLDVVLEANAENIPVVVFDSGLADGAELVSYVATDNYHGGVLAAEKLAEAMGGQGNVILLRYKEGSESTEQREEGFLETLNKMPEIKILSSDQYAGTTTESALAMATQLLNKYDGEVNGIFAVCEPNCNGTLEALVQTGSAGKVKFIAFDSSDRLIAGLSDDSVSGIVLQDPFEMGRQSVLAIAAHLRGETVEPKTSTGEYVATGENQHTAPYDRLLKPGAVEH